ncbi:hypothetical protein COO60DRAFT_1584121 [Scenedesmus sp. NREL 46B-D3]|nr:hypothetical protein COO60DRAFT_1584121 [Scenedesmus sp. NREL 46B-D3]
MAVLAGCALCMNLAATSASARTSCTTPCTIIRNSLYSSQTCPLYAEAAQVTTQPLQHGFDGQTYNVPMCLPSWSNFQLSCTVKTTCTANTHPRHLKVWPQHVVAHAGCNIHSPAQQCHMQAVGGGGCRPCF